MKNSYIMQKIRMLQGSLVNGIGRQEEKTRSTLEDRIPRGSDHLPAGGPQAGGGAEGRGQHSLHLPPGEAVQEATLAPQQTQKLI